VPKVDGVIDKDPILFLFHIDKLTGPVDIDHFPLGCRWELVLDDRPDLIVSSVGFDGPRRTFDIRHIDPFSLDFGLQEAEGDD
jgi:hypothetical protein